MKYTRNNKIIIIGIVIFLLIIVLSLLLVSFSTSKNNKDASKQLRALAIENHWGTAQDFPDCNKEEKACVNKASELIINGLQISVPYIHFDQQILDSGASEMEYLIVRSRYPDVLAVAQDLVKVYKTDYAATWLKNKSDFLAIEKASRSLSLQPSNSIFIANYLLNLPFAKASLFISNGNNTDLGFVYLKKNANDWSIIAGPGTSFTNDELKAVGLDDPLITTLDHTLNIPVFYNPERPPANIYRSINNYVENNQVQQEATLLLKLPYTSSNKTYTIDYRVNNNNLDDLTFLVNVYYQNSDQTAEIRKEASSWLKSMGINSKSKVQYKEFLTSSDEGL